MFDISFLHVIREFEYGAIKPRLPAKGRILEIGGGTGYQAKRFLEDGYDIESIEIPESNYAQQLDFPVKFYDGKNIPFPNECFDLIYSSNVLEHVTDLEFLQAEIKRVLRPGGYCIHLMPSATWRYWTILAHYVELIQKLLKVLLERISAQSSRQFLRNLFRQIRRIAATMKSYAIVPRHGEYGNAFTELFSFSAKHWRYQFEKQGFEISDIYPAGLFYTGHMLLGSRMNLPVRQRLAKWLGSACIVYVVRPTIS